jgi:hypothetical protein
MVFVLEDEKTRIMQSFVFKMKYSEEGAIDYLRELLIDKSKMIWVNPEDSERVTELDEEFTDAFVKLLKNENQKAFDVLLSKHLRPCPEEMWKAFVESDFFRRAMKALAEGKEVIVYEGKYDKTSNYGLINSMLYIKRDFPNLNIKLVNKAIMARLDDEDPEMIRMISYSIPHEVNIKKIVRKFVSLIEEGNEIALSSAGDMVKKTNNPAPESVLNAFANDEGVKAGKGLIDQYTGEMEIGLSGFLVYHLILEGRASKKHIEMYAESIEKADDFQYSNGSEIVNLYSRGMGNRKISEALRKISLDEIKGAREALYTIMLEGNLDSILEDTIVELLSPDDWDRTSEWIGKTVWRGVTSKRLLDIFIERVKEGKRGSVKDLETMVSAGNLSTALAKEIFKDSELREKYYLMQFREGKLVFDKLPEDSREKILKLMDTGHFNSIDGHKRFFASLGFLRKRNSKFPVKEIVQIINGASNKSFRKQVLGLLENIVSIITIDKEFSLENELFPPEGYPPREKEEKIIWEEEHKFYRKWKGAAENSVLNIENLMGRTHTVLQLLVTKEFGFDSEDDELKKGIIDILDDHPELLQISFKLRKHYKSKRWEEQKKNQAEAFESYLRKKHMEFKYRELVTLIEKFGLTKNIGEEWVNTLERTKSAGEQALTIGPFLERIENIGDLTEKQKGEFRKLFSSLKVKEDEELDHAQEVLFVEKLQKKAEESSDVLAGIINSMLRDIRNLRKVDKIVITDEFKFKEAHQIGEHWKTCQSWSSPGKYNKCLVSFINDATKKYIIVKSKNEWIARGIIQLALDKDEKWILVLDDLYGASGSLKNYIVSFAELKAEKLGIPYKFGIHRDLNLFGKVPHTYSDNMRGIVPQTVITEEGEVRDVQGRLVKIRSRRKPLKTST